MAPRRRCPVCDSRQWHKEPYSGLIACSEGHILQNYRNEVKDVEEMGPHAVRKRKLRTARKRKENDGRADPKLYHGLRARYHYFQCQQFILRRQIATLTTLWNLPPEFEVICRDIWALHLTLLPNAVPAEPYHYMRETFGPEGRPDPDVRETTPESDIGDDRREKDDVDPFRQNANRSDQEHEDPELAKLLQENSESSSSSSSSSESEVGADPIKTRTASESDEIHESTSKQKKKRSVGTSPYEGPESCIAVLMLACWTLRVPALYRDFARIIEQYQLPYLDPMRYLPGSMSLHLTKYTSRALSPPHAPSTLSLHTLTARLAKLMYKSYGILTPEANAAPILWRSVRCLGGTPTLYTLTKRLAHVLSLPLTLHHSLAPSLTRAKKRDPEMHKYDNVPPELALVVTVIVVLKMVYGLDGRLRRPSDSSDPACALPRVDEYMQFLKQLDAEDMQSKEAMFSSKSTMSVGDLNAEMMDDYLEFCERALLGPGESAIDGQILLANYFPISERPAAAVAAGEREPINQPGLAATLPDANSGVLRPGEAYMIFNPRDVLGSVPDEYETVLRRSARWVGVEEEYVGRVVEMYERRAVRWWQQRRRRAREEEDSEG